MANTELIVLIASGCLSGSSQKCSIGLLFKDDFQDRPLVIYSKGRMMYDLRVYC